MKTPNKFQITTVLLNALVLACFALSVMAQEAPDVSPPPDGGYAGGNTAEGQKALLSLISGTYNNAVVLTPVTALRHFWSTTLMKIQPPVLERFCLTMRPETRPMERLRCSLTRRASTIQL